MRSKNQPEQNFVNYLGCNIKIYYMIMRETILDRFVFDNVNKIRVLTRIVFDQRFCFFFKYQMIVLSFVIPFLATINSK